MEQNGNHQNQTAGNAGPGPQVYYQQGPNGKPIYYQQGPNGEAIYYQIGENGQPVFFQPVQQQPVTPPPVYAQPPVQKPAYAQEDAAPGAKKPKKKKKHRLLLFLLEVVVLLVLAGGLYVAASLSKIKRVEIQDEEIKQEVQQQLTVEKVQKLEQGYRTLAFFGVDARDASDNGQSDTIIICSIDKETKEVRLASVFRDTYLDSDGTFKKATDVYGGYGVERSIRMLNRNLDLPISDFVTVNMKIVADVVNAIGGIEIDVREDEVVHLNNYQVEGSEITGLPIVPVEAPGPQLLNGLQAMSYCRIRYTVPIDDEHPGLDYERAMRQRVVLEKILEKVKKMDIGTITGLINKVFPNIATSLTQTEILSIAKDVTNYTLVDTVGWPFEKVTADTSAGDCVVPVNLAKNVEQLQKFLYPKEEYTVSPTVQEISDNIAYTTGVY